MHRLLIVLSLAACVAPALARERVVGQTQLVFRAQGMPNTIAGTWSAAPLRLRGPAEIRRFDVALVSFWTDYGGGQDGVHGGGSMSFVSATGANAVGMYWCAASWCVAEPIAGARAEVSDGEAHAFLSRLVHGSGWPDSGPMSIAFPGGGAYTEASGEIRVVAWGEAGPPSPIPEPSAWAMLAAGVVMVTAARRRRKADPGPAAPL